MSIQVTLNANEFAFTGTYEDREYTSLRFKSCSNGRIYLFTIKNGMKLNTMAKKMQLDNGKVFVSFGKQGKLYIGTYTDDSIVIEDTQEAIEETKQDEQTLVDTFTTDQYKIKLLSSIDHLNHKYVLTGEACYKYDLVFTDIQTGSINEELSDTIYLSKEAALKVINSYITKPKEETTPIKPHKQINNKTNQTKSTVKESIPQINMIASYANILYKGNEVNIVFTNEQDTNIVTYKYRKSWSHRKYIDKSLEQTGINPSYDFMYGWEYVS